MTFWSIGWLLALPWAMTAQVNVMGVSNLECSGIRHASVDGQVLNARGEALGGVRVALGPVAGPDGVATVETRTDSQGRFSFADVSAEDEISGIVDPPAEWRGAEPLLHEAARFYAIQLEQHPEAVACLLQRGVRSPELIEHMQIGYAPGGCLQGWLTQLGYSLPTLRQAGLVTSAGYDASSASSTLRFPITGIWCHLTPPPPALPIVQICRA